MLRNYLIITWRTLLKNKIFSIINIVGFAAGIAVCLLILLYIVEETRFDHFNKNFHTLYRVAQEQNQSGVWYKVGRTPAPLATALQQDIPELVNATRFALWGDVLLKYGDKLIDEPGGIYAEKSLFQMFDFPFVQGTYTTAFTHPHSIILTESFASKYFGTDNPIGKQIQLNNQYSLLVTGVIKDIPAQSHLQFDFVIPFEFIKEYGTDLTKWGANAFYTYVQLSEEANVEEVQAKIRNYFHTKPDRNEEILYLQALKDIHLYSQFDFNTDFGVRGDIRYVRFFSLTAGIVLLIAIFNFMNLSTARASRRAKEVGLRKVVGADRKQLIFQFLGESLLFSLIAGILSLTVVQLALPFFNGLTGKQLTITTFDPTYLWMFSSLIIIVGLLAGIYPASFLSSFSPAKVLKGQPLSFSKGVLLRKVLVTGQFSLSIIMIIGTILINRQLQYISTKKLGLTKDNLVYVEMRGQLKDNYSLVKNELLQNTSIQAVSGTNYYSMPFKWVGSDGSGGIEFPGKNPNDHFMIHQFRVEYDFIETLQASIKDGRSFSASISTDTANFLLNEAAVRRMQLTNPVGQPISFYGKKGIVVGVVKDFHFTSMQKEIEPALVHINPQDISYLLIRIKSEHTKTALASIKKIVEKYSHDYPVEYHFMEDAYDALYKSEQRMSSLFNAFAILAIVVSGLGLFGLASFITAGRTKEVGVRKVLGASVSSILLLLSKEFIKLLLVASLLGWPLAFLGLKQWLQNYAFQTEVSVWLFVLPSLAVCLISICIISFHTWKVARANPAHVLRNE
jgi:ABC-type antimicrobial peptide transport system permease subunit